MENSKKSTAQIEPEKIATVLEEISRNRENLIPALQQIQKMYGYLPEEALEFISDNFNIPLAKVLGVATFYSQFYLEPQGEHTIKVCKGTACHVKGADTILSKLKDELNILPGKVTDDGKFTLTTVRCLGCCSLAPVLMVDDNTHGNLTRENVVEILERYR